VVTNPDMLHTGILPHHTKWQKLFANLKYVVVDELHIYRGVFGSHVTNVFRRLKRICRFYGQDPVFICCSATVANPKTHAENLLEREVALIDESGAPRAEKTFISKIPSNDHYVTGYRGGYLPFLRRDIEKGLRDRSVMENAYDPTVSIFDAYPGGIGFSDNLFERHDELIRAARSLISSCPCDHGCPMCVGPTLEVGPSAKHAAMQLLDLMEKP